MRSALIIGIDDYRDIMNLSGCVTDARGVEKLLSTNEDESQNFETRLIINSQATRRKIRKEMRDLFNGTSDIALLYFSGHGTTIDDDGFIVTHDFEEDDIGISMPEIFKMVNKSNIKNKVLIFDCCYAGSAGTDSLFGELSILSEGLTILTSSRSNQTSMEINGQGLFTTLFNQALEGSASDILGNTPIGSIYAFIDRAIGSFGQRPVFKTNVVSFVSLRQNKPKISIGDLRKITNLFKLPNDEYKLDSSYESTNKPGWSIDNHEPYYIEKNGEILTLLQSFTRNALVVPVGEEHMYYAAMHSKSCKLTPLGKYYWRLVKERKI